MGKHSQKYEIKRLVLTAPIDTYKVTKVVDKPLPDISLMKYTVDEPTAASLGINVPFGSKVIH